MISNAYGTAGNDKLSLYNGIMIMAIVRLYYHAPMPICAYHHIVISRYHSMLICANADKTIKFQNTSLIDLQPGLLGS